MSVNSENCLGEIERILSANGHVFVDGIHNANDGRVNAYFRANGDTKQFGELFITDAEIVTNDKQSLANLIEARMQQAVVKAAVNKQRAWR